jgi:D-alanyl-D-alanine carboxypeptidase (penicillin-binding protein 5/6)
VGAWLLSLWLAVQAVFGVPPLTCQCRAAVVVAAETGQVLGGVHAYRQMDPASLTKMLTAYIVIRAGDLNRPVTISARAVRVEGSKLRVRTGQVYTRLDLLRGLLLRSGNDAAVALAESEAGSVRRFAALMNRTARALGATNSHFVNPNGLTAPGHYSSAYDLAVIARAALRLPLFQHLVSLRQDTVQELTSGQAREIGNTNALLEAYPGADGVKTGTTAAAGRCLVASATRDGVQLIVVVLHSRDRWRDAADALDWGFRYFHPVAVARRHQTMADVQVAGGVVRQVPLWTASPVTVLQPENSRLSVLVTAPGRVPAPVRQGTRLGSLDVMAGSERLLTVPLYAARSVPRRRLPLPWSLGRTLSRGSWGFPFSTVGLR